MSAQMVINLPLLTDLKVSPVDPGVEVFLLGKTSVGDGLGGFYFWDPSATGVEDTVFMNIIPSNLSTTGRWVRVFQKATNLPHGVLVTNGGVKTFYASGVTDSNGQATLNITTDNTATGPSIFSEVWFNLASCFSTGSTATTAVQDYLISQDLKTTKHGFFTANPVTISLGLVYSPFASVGTGKAVRFRVEGI